MTTPKQELKRAKAALKLAQKLNAANEATRQFIFACCDCGGVTRLPVQLIFKAIPCYSPKTNCRA